MDHMYLHPARAQPTCQPKPVPPSLVGKHDPRDHSLSPDRLVPPAFDHPHESPAHRVRASSTADARSPVPFQQSANSIGLALQRKSASPPGPAPSETG